MGQKREQIAFFILAVLIILIGHQFLQGDNFLTGAALTKTTSSKTTTDTTTTNTTASKTTNETSSTDTTTETEPAEKTTAPATTPKTPLAGKATAHPQTKSTTTRDTGQTTITKVTTTEKEGIVVKEFTATKIVLENKGTIPLTIIPTVKAAPFSLPNEENLARLVREKIQAENKLISAEELSRMVKRKVAGIQAIEKANVKPLYVRKIYRPWETITGQSVGDIMYTGQATAGELLSPQLLDPSRLILQPQEQVTANLTIRESLAIEEQAVNISFNSNGQEVLTQEFSFPPSKTGTAIDLHPDDSLFDLYVVINPGDGERTGEKYYVEMVLKKGNTVTYFELLGPYTIRGTEPTLFSQQFKYPSQYAGEYIFTATIYQNRQRIIRQEHSLKLK